MTKAPSYDGAQACEAKLNGTGDLVGTKAPCAGVYMTGRTVNDCFYTLNVRLPCPVGTSVGMGNLNTKG